MIRRTLIALAMAVALPLLVACGDDGASNVQEGSLSLLLTDAPGDFTEATVQIDRIELAAEAEGEAQVLMDTPVTTDLLTLSNDVAALVEDATVTTGTYSQLRFIISGACISVEQDDGSQKVFASQGFGECGTADGSLQLPSFAQTGIKVNLPGGSIEVTGEQKVLLVDFDVSQSFGQEGGESGMWVMTPVINATDVSLTGSVVVELTAPDSVDLSTLDATLGDFQARLETEASPQPFRDPDVDGVFTANFQFLMPEQDYDVSVELQDDVSFNFTLDPTSPQTVTVNSGQESTIGFEVTSASSP